MECPNCGCRESKVKDSRHRKKMYRRRECNECRNLFTTYEMTQDEILVILDEALNENFLDAISTTLSRHMPVKDGRYKEHFEDKRSNQSMVRPT